MMLAMGLNYYTSPICAYMEQRLHECNTFRVRVHETCSFGVATSPFQRVLLCVTSS